MGLLSKHSSSVPLVLKPDTGAITQEFHMVFDNWFSTITTSIDNLPDFRLTEWACMLGDRMYQFIESNKHAQPAVPWTLMLRLPPGHMKLNQVHASGSGPYWPTDPSHLASNELSLSCALNPHYLPTCGPGTISSPHPLPTPDPLSSPAAAPTPSQDPSTAPMQLCHQRESPSNPD